ncbi:MAG: hypothetical protein E7320_10055 [Clostridiales bacterium]|nr:hypothetical protein [Clostridiales bacterium]
MPLSKKRSITYLLLIAAALLFAYSLRFVFHPMTENALSAIAMMTLRWAIQVTLTLLWCVSIRRRILNTAIQKMLLSVGGLLLFWQVARIIKYDYVIVTGPIGRYCWYSYYIPMVLVPLIGVFVVDHIGKPEGYHSPRWMKYLFIPAFFLIAMVMTNDLHQLVFTFHNGFELYNSDYGYGFMYIFEMAWFVVLAMLFAVMLLFKSRVPGSKNFQRLPLFVTIFAILFWAGYSAKLYTGDLTAVDCIFIVLLLEGAIQSGLIPSNMNYRGLFERSTIAARIVDGQGQTYYASANAAPLEKAVMEQAQHETVDLGDTLLHHQAIHGGHIYWQDDVKTINDLAEHLREANDMLGERYDLMKAEVELRERRLQTEEKSRLYDRIALEIAPQLNKVDELLSQSREHPEAANALLSQVCVISAYIKRRANLILLGEEKATVAARELESCLRESLDNLRLCGVITYLDCHCDGQAAVEQIVAMYDLFENVTEMLQSKLSAMMVTASYTDGVLRLRIQAGCKEAVNESLNLTLDGGTVTCEVQDEDLLIEAVLQGGAKA